MTRICTDLDLRVLPGNRWMLLKPFRVQLDALQGGVVSVPARFVTDLSSVPRIPVVYWRLGGRARKGATVHDYLYETQPPEIPRELADQCFYEIAVFPAEPEPGGDGEVRARAWAMWAGIRAGGSRAWSSGPARFKLHQNWRVERRRSASLVR